MVYKVFNKNGSCGYVTRVDKSSIKHDIMTNQHPQELAPEIQQKNCISQLLENLKVYFSFKGITWGSDLAHMQLKSKFLGNRYV